jgi:signal transduction histidine kinase
VERTAEQSVGELRRILALLRAPGSDGAAAGRPAEVRPAPSLDELGELVEEYRGAGLPVRLEVEGSRRRLPDGVELSVYRIVEEALTNVLKHTRARDVVVRLRYAADALDVRVDDDGEPRHPADGADPGRAAGHGILGMRERVAALGGELAADVRPGGGFRVEARVPTGDAA